MKKKELLYWGFLLPSLVGMLLFYGIPFLLSVYYSFLDNMANKQWVGIKNYSSLFANDLFRQASWNTLRFIGIAVPVGMILSLLLVLAMQQLGKRKNLALFLLLIPLVLPSGTIISFWQTLFGVNGVWNKVRDMCGLPIVNLGNGESAFWIIVLIFLWKNISYNAVLFWSGINWIPKTYYEQCQLEGGGRWKQFRYITWVYLSPTTFVVLLMSLVNSFKVFKEIYMLYGGYPTSSIYMLQHYMNNQFTAMNMQKLSSASFLTFLVLGGALLVIFRIQKKITDSFH